MKPLRDVLTEVHSLGVTRFMFDLAKDSRTITALTDDGPNEQAARLLNGHKAYILAHMRISGEPMSFDEVEHILGIVRGLPAPTERDQLMAALGWPTETLTLEELRIRQEVLQCST